MWGRSSRSEGPHSGRGGAPGPDASAGHGNGAASGRALLLRWAFLAAIGLTVVAVAAGALSAPGTGRARATLAAAASLRNVLPELVGAFEGGEPDRMGAIEVTYGPSGGLRMQIEGGAPIDGVLFANDVPVDRLVERGLVGADTRRVVASNTIRLIGAKGSRKVTFEDLGSLRDGEKLAVGDPGAVPAGHYARSHLRQLGKWTDVQDHLIYAGDVAAVLAYARRGEVEAAIVYATDTKGIDDIDVLDEARLGGAERPVVVAGITRRGSDRPIVHDFMRFIASPRGQAIFRKHGFGPPDGPDTSEP